MSTPNLLPKGQTTCFSSTSALLLSLLRRSRIKAAEGCALAALFVAPSAAQAQITFTILNPVGTTQATAEAISGTQEAGNATNTTTGQVDAAIWSGTAGSFVDLAPTSGGVVNSALNATSGTLQAGTVVIQMTVGQTTTFPTYAAFWSGTAASYTNLNPSTATASFALAISGTQEAGYATFSGVSHAGIWSGSAGSFLDLNPAGSTNSAVCGTDGTHQVGYASIGGIQNAALWTGTAGSYLSLNPAGANTSEALAISGTQEVGFSVIGGGGETAGLWTGTAASYVNLNPNSLTGTSEALATDGTQQVGYARIGGQLQAALWSGTSASYFNLQTSLGAGFQSSQASGIDDNGTTTFVTGTAATTGGMQDAILWAIPDSSLPEPGTGLLGGLALGMVGMVGRFRRQK